MASNANDGEEMIVGTNIPVDTHLDSVARLGESIRTDSSGRSEPEDDGRDYKSELSQVLMRMKGRGSQDWSQRHIDNLRNLVARDRSLLEFHEERNGETALHIAAEFGILNGARELIKLGAKTEATDRDKRQPLHIACLKGQEELADLLLKEGADIEARQYQGTTPLDDAVQHITVVKLLLDNDAKTQVKSSDGWTPLHRTTSEVITEVLPRLLEHDRSNINDTENNEHWTALNVAVYFGRREFIPILIEFGARLDIPDNDGWAPWMTVSEKQPDIIKILHTELRGTIPHLEVYNSVKDTPLVAATRHGLWESVASLIEIGADCTAKGYNDRKPLHWNLEDILRDPPFTHIHQYIRSFPSIKPKPNSVERLEKAEASVTQFFQSHEESGNILRYRSVKDVIFGPGPKEIMENAVKAFTNITEKESGLLGHSFGVDTKPYFTWVHLPSTNIDWMKNLLRTIMEKDNCNPRQYYEVNSFFSDSLAQIPDEDLPSRYMRPRTTTRSYAYTDSKDGGKERDCSTTDEGVSEQGSDRAESDGVDAEEKDEPEAKQRNIAYKWLMTATFCVADDSHDKIEEVILDLLYKQADSRGSSSQPKSAADISKLVVEYFIGSYERTTKLKSLMSVGQIFSQCLNQIGRVESLMFDDFRIRTQSWQIPGARNGQNRMRQSSGSDDVGLATQSDSSGTPPTASTDEEIRDAIRRTEHLFTDIKDVRDELNVLKAIVQYQKIVERGLAGENVKDTDLLAENILGDIKEMEVVAERIQLAVNATLCLQQNEIANFQATLATTQGKTVMAFTFATVLFLPLSFLSSLFALDVASFQKAPAWVFYVILLVSAAISLFLAFAAYHWEQLKALFRTAYKGFPSSKNDGNDEGMKDAEKVTEDSGSNHHPSIGAMFHHSKGSGGRGESYV
ncbi:ankyrin unc44 [Fusarium acutatum]|uniref:Ankyrin unc44 n=1 Tax=Fusarium acutatum TaxID=78861 RepID=A0A8H4NK74_9HYPO|nr:ankyrin unc44 [Fusarium acutatum]